MSVALLADVLRATSAVASLAMALVAGYAITLCSTRDQVVRFLVLLGYGAALGSSNLLALGGPFRWQLPVYTVLGVSGVLSSLIFVRREVKVRRDAL